MRDTAATIPSSAAIASRRDRTARWRRSAAVPVVLGAALVALSLPRIGMEAYLLEARDTLEELEAGRMESAEQRQLFTDKISVLAKARQSPRIDAMAARAWIALGRQSAGAADRQAAMAQAQAFQTAGLAAAPADQYGWQRLSFILAERNDWIASARAWQLGLVTGPFEPTIMPTKFEAGLALWRYMNLPERETFAELTAKFAQTRPDQLAALTEQYEAEAIVRQALTGRPELEIFEKNLAWRRKP